MPFRIAPVPISYMEYLHGNNNNNNNAIIHLPTCMGFSATIPLVSTVPALGHYGEMISTCNLAFFFFPCGAQYPASSPCVGFPSVSRETRIRLLYEICRARHLFFLVVVFVVFVVVVVVVVDSLWSVLAALVPGTVLSTGDLSPIPARGCNGCHE